MIRRTKDKLLSLLINPSPLESPTPPWAKGVSPPKGGRHSRKAHSRGHGHRRQSRLSAGKMEWEGKGCLSKGMFGGVVWPFGILFLVPLETKQHSVPLSATSPIRQTKQFSPAM